MNKRTIPWIILLPMILVMVIFVFYPIGVTFYYSLHRFQLTKPNQTAFIGLENYWRILTSSDFKFAFQNSLLALLFVTVIAVTASVSVGLLLNVKSPLTPLLTGIAIIPWALPPMVNGIIWSFMFHGGYGLFNKIFIFLGILDRPYGWTTNRYALLLIVSIIVAWRVVPFCALIVLSNLQAIPNDLYEAAKIDGASSISRFRHITLPAIVPSLGIILIQVTMAGLNVFDEIVALVGYRYEGQTLLIYNYLNTFSFLNFGYGSAITYIIMIISGIVGYFYVKSLTPKLEVA